MHKPKNITFEELAEIKFALADQMWHHFLVKTYDLKNQSFQKDNLSCLRSYLTRGKQTTSQSSCSL